MTLITTASQDIANCIQLDEKAKTYIAQAKSENTRKAYKSDWDDFNGWCIAHGYTSLPASPIVVMRYLTDRASYPRTKFVRKGRSSSLIEVTLPALKPASIDRRLVSISKAHQFVGLEFDKRHIALTETVKGIKNNRGIKQLQKAPILISDLQGMVMRLGNTSIGIRDKAILLLGFVAALRRSELVSLQANDVVITRDGIELTIKRSKTDQAGEGVTLPVPYGSNPDTCPVRAIQDWRMCSGITEGPLFRSINQWGQIGSLGLCSASISLIIKRNAYLAGNTSVYSGHSLRAGFCTTAASNGVPEHSIMRQSRHKKSDTVKKYIRLANMWQDCAATKLGL